MSAVLQVEGLTKSFPVSTGAGKHGLVRAVDGISFSVDEGEAFALVGESGCGKSTVARCLVGLLAPNSGKITISGSDAAELKRTRPREFYRHLQMIFQDPYASLNPRLRVGGAVAEPMIIDGKLSRSEIRTRVSALLVEVGLAPEAAEKYPHEFSGGQRQRIAIARALALEPAVLIADEPVSALDVSVQSQILMLLDSLRQSRKLSLLFIAHDLAVVRNFCQRAAVMYLGRIVETGSVADVLEHPLHPYTAALRDSTLPPDPSARQMLVRIEGEMPSALNAPSGCHFHPRCPKRLEKCSSVAPVWVARTNQHGASCHLLTS